MENNKFLIIKKESFISRIKSFFCNLFKKNKQEKEEIIQDIVIPKEKDKNFSNAIKIESVKEKDKIQLIQNKIDNGILDEDSIYQAIKNLTQEEISSLKELYNNQILEIERNINEYKTKIISARQMLNNT